MDEPGIDRVWDLMESVRFCMFATWNGSNLRARPMGAFVRREEGVVYFFTDVRAHKDEEFREFPQVCLAFADTSGEKYVSVSGTAELILDRKKIEELWSVPPKVWWGSPEDPNVRLVRVRPENAEYWDSPGNLISSMKIAFKLLTGAHVHHGDHEKVAF